MINDKTWLTCKEASVLLNYTQRHIVNLIKKGKLSADRDETGQYFIEKSEFFRVYPHAMPHGNTKKLTENNKRLDGNERELVQEEIIKHLQSMLDERKKHNDFLIDQLNSITEEKSKMLDAINSHARLLEYKESSFNSEDKKSVKGWIFKRR